MTESQLILLSSLTFIVGMIIGYLYKPLNIFSGTKVKDVPFKIPIKQGHVKPQYYGYKGGFTSITVCGNEECGRTALYEDQHPVNPCPLCGNKVYESIPGKWAIKDGEKQWVTRED